MSAFEKAMEEVLKRSKYDYLTGRLENLRQIIANFIIDTLRKIFDMLNLDFSGFGPGINENVLANVFIVVGVVTAVIIISIIVYLIIKRHKKNRVIDDIFDEFRENTLSYADITDLILKYDNEGNHRLAVRYRYIGLIMLISSSGIVKITDAMTGGQFIKSVYSNANSLYIGTKDVVDMYYTLYFGHKDISEDVYSAHKDLFDKTVKEVINIEKI
ncbi:MAG: hypothetical protein LBU94_03540 [Clostridiales bacterium]|jgi:hypothetical protein|nr:hypothetical protein [Clostridiales bacterium]